MSYFFKKWSMVFLLQVDTYLWFQSDLYTCADSESYMSGLSGCLKEEAMGLLPVSQGQVLLSLSFASQQ